MNSNKTPVAGPGKFQWNAGGWFGSSLGSSAWMLGTSGCLFACNQQLIAIIPGIGFVAIVLTSIALWNRRNCIYPFSALMTILGLIAFTNPFVWLIVQTLGSAESKSAMNWPASSWSTVFAIAIVPVVMLWFIYLERTAIARDSELTQNSKTVA
jgi:hypothetical protein